ncbi:aa3-type cytochrome oxidase subunit IV [Streptomyces sp. TP-A0874]|uniref:aa3-type cytochrome oxidase subunit IV n=1 Tax=Streptomyces sp. TP-A0874 TaxID=549819 RepID=UPI0008536060|nr:cytochrome c oxidase subunit 4 [Streptomyces sp. TP-A0874]
MKAEALLFAGVALFFAATAAVYGRYSTEPAGTVALLVSFLMSGLIAFFLWTQFLRHGRRPQDRKNVPVHWGSGRLAFFSPRSYYPVLTGAGAAVTAVGVIYGLWLFLIGLGVLACGVLGFVFQHNNR